MLERFVAIPDPYDLGLTLGILQHGFRDPTTRVSDRVAWRASRTPDGAATARYVRVDGGVRVAAWGPGAERALDAAPALLGCEDDPASYGATHPLLRDLARRFLGVRYPKTRTILEHLIPSITEQKVPSRQAWIAYAGIVRRCSERAPGPGGLWLPADPARGAALPYHAVHRYGLEKRRADVVRRACARASRLEESAGMDPDAARRRMQTIPGVGAWTAAEVTRVSHGDPDAVSVGDFHLPHVVGWALAGEPRGSDERMLELLDAERPHRGRAIRLIELAGFRAPAFGPRQRLRSIAEI